MNALILAIALFWQSDVDLFGEPQVNVDLFGDAPDFNISVAPARLLPKVTFFSPSWCSGCQQLERAFAGNTDFDISWVHGERAFPVWVQEGISRGLTYPVAYWEAAPGKWRSLYGVSDVASFKEHWLACGKNPTINTVTAPSRHVSRGGLYYGTYRSVYDWPGDLRQHLTHSPHNYQASYVNGLSDSGCIQLHDSWHISHDSGSAGVPRRRGPIARMFGRG